MKVVKKIESLTTFTGSCEFKIEGYSKLMKNVGQHPIKSPTFHVGETSWGILFYPDGETSESKEFVSFYLANKTEKVVEASYKLTLVGTNTQKDFKPTVNPRRFAPARTVSKDSFY